MALDVLALVQNADHVEGVCTFPDINHVRTRSRFADSGA